MASPQWSKALERARSGLVTLARSSSGARRLMARVGDELLRAAHDAVATEGRSAERASEHALYRDAYFGEGRDPGGDRQGHSGYATYDRVSSNADIAAYLLWRNFGARRSLDVGCAKGYLVEALRELGLEAEGSDVSAFAVGHAAPGALGHVRLGDLVLGLPYDDGAFDLVSALEILEHLEPAQVPAALDELARVSGGAIVATIPSFGVNVSGPDGHFEGKVRPERLEWYRSLGPDYQGPVPRDDLALDTDGGPVEGHLCIASYSWWSDRFADAGLERRPDVERRLYADIAPAGLGRFWNLYVFTRPGAVEELTTPKSPGRTLGELGLIHPLLEHAAMEAAVAEEG
jgi:SAM-dependent methyltransferase